MSKKIDYRIVIGIILVLFIVEHTFFYSKDQVEDAIVIVPEKVGGVKKKVDSIVRDTIYIDKIIPGNKLPARKKIVVDSTYKSDYERAIKENDSLKAKNIFLESIALDTYEGTLINNKEIKIDGKFLTRGKLLEYDVNYKIKKDTVTYIPKVVTKFPKFSIVGGVDLSMPTSPLNKSEPLISAHVGFRNKKGNTISFGIDNLKRFTVGYEITLFKTKR